MLFPVPSDLYFVLLRFLEYLSVITVAWHGSGYNSIFEFGVWRSSNKYPSWTGLYPDTQEFLIVIKYKYNNKDE